MTDESVDQEPENSKDFEISPEEDLAHTVAELLQNSDFAQAIETIEDFYKANLNKDISGQIANHCNLLKAQVFEQQRGYQKALSLYYSLSQEIEPSHPLFVYHKLDLVRVLRKMGNVEEAILEIEKTFEQQANNAILALLNLLDFYVDMLEERSEVFPIKHQPLLRDLINGIGLEELLDSNFEDPSFMNMLVNEVSRKNGEANKRYGRLLIELDEVEDESQIDSLLRSYISKEKVGYYRNLAIEELTEPET